MVLHGLAGKLCSQSTIDRGRCSNNVFAMSLHTDTTSAALLGHHSILSASIGDPILLIYLPTAYHDSVPQCWSTQASSSISRSESACCPVVELRQLVVSFFQRWFAESFMALQNFGPGLSNSYQAFSSSPTTAVLVHNLFPSFNCRSISLFWMISTSS
jgi:hypothetical protein